MKKVTKLGRIFDEYGEEIPYEEFWEMVEETKKPMPDGSAKWITHDDTSSGDISFCWEQEGFAWTNRDFT